MPAGSLWPGYAIYRAWFVGVVTLADLPGVAPAKKVSPEMTHEVVFIAADPNVDYDPDPGGAENMDEVRLQGCSSVRGHR